MSQIRSYAGDYLQQTIQDRKFKDSVTVYVNTVADAEALEHLVGPTFRAQLARHPRPHARCAALRTLALTQLYVTRHQLGDEILVLAPGPGEWPHVRAILASGAKVDVAYPPPESPEHAENIERMKAFLCVACQPQRAEEGYYEEPQEMEPGGHIYYNATEGRLYGATDQRALTLHIARAEDMKQRLYTHVYGSFVADGVDIETLTWNQPRAIIRLSCHRPECYHLHTYRLENDTTIFFEDRVYDYEEEHLRVTFLCGEAAVRFTTHNGQAQEPAQWYDVSTIRLRQRYLPKIGNSLCKFEPVGRSTVGVWSLIPCLPGEPKVNVVHTDYYTLPDLRVQSTQRSIIMPRTAYFDWCADVANMSSINPGSCAQLLRGRMSQIGDRRNMQSTGCHTWQLHKKDYAILAAWIFIETVHGAKMAAETISNAKHRFLRYPRASANRYLREVASLLTFGGISSNESRDAAARLMRESHLNGCGPRPITVAYYSADSPVRTMFPYVQACAPAEKQIANYSLGPRCCGGTWFNIDPPPSDRHCFSTSLAYITGVQVPPIAPTVEQANVIIRQLKNHNVLCDGKRELRILDGEQPHAIARVRELLRAAVPTVKVDVSETISKIFAAVLVPPRPQRGVRRRPLPPHRTRRQLMDARRFDELHGQPDPNRARRERSVSPPLKRRRATRREANLERFEHHRVPAMLTRSRSAPHTNTVEQSTVQKPKRVYEPLQRPVLRRQGSLDPPPKVRGQRSKSCSPVERFTAAGNLGAATWQLLCDQEHLALFAAQTLLAPTTGRVQLTSLIRAGGRWMMQDVQANSTLPDAEGSFHRHLQALFTQTLAADDVPVPDMLCAPPAAAKSAALRNRGYLVVVPTNELRDEWMGAERQVDNHLTSVVRTWDKVFLTAKQGRTKTVHFDTIVFDEFVVFTPERVAFTVAFLIAAEVLVRDCRIILLGDTNQGGTYAPDRQPTAWREVAARRFFYPHTYGMCSHAWNYLSKIVGAEYPAPITAHGACGVRIETRDCSVWPKRKPNERQDVMFRSCVLDKDIEARGAAISAQGSRWRECKELHLYLPKLDRQRGDNDAYTHAWTLLTRCVYTDKHRLTIYGPWPAFNGCKPLVRGRDELWPLPPPPPNAMVTDVNTALVTSAVGDDGRIRAVVHQCKVDETDHIKERKVVEIQNTQPVLGNEFLKRGELTMIPVRAADANRLPIGANFGTGNELLRVDWELWRSLQYRNPYSHYVGENPMAPSAITSEILRGLVKDAAAHRGWTLTVDQLTQREMRPQRMFLGNDRFFESAAAHSASDPQRTAVCMLKRLIAPNYNSLMRHGSVPSEMRFDVSQQIHIGRYVYEQMASRSKTCGRLDAAHVAVLVATVIDLRTAAKAVQTLDRSYFDGIIRNLEDHQEESVHNTLFELDVENANDTRKAMIVKTQLKLVEKIQSLYGKAGQPVLSADRAYTYLQRNLRTLCKILPVLVSNRFPAGGGFEIMQAATFGYGAPAAVDEWDSRVTTDLFYSVDVESCDTTYTGIPIGFVSALYDDPANWVNAPKGLGDRIERYLRVTLGFEAPVKVVVISVGGRYQIRGQLASGDLITLDLNTVSTICNWIQSHCYQWRNCEEEGYVNIGHGVWVKDLGRLAKVLRSINTGDDANIEVSESIEMVAENKVFIGFKEKLINWRTQPLDFCHQLRVKHDGKVWRTHDFFRTFAKITARKFSAHVPTAKAQIKEIVTAVRDLCEGCQSNEAVGMATSILAKFYGITHNYTESVIRQVIAYSRCSHLWLFDECYTAPVRSFVEAERSGATTL